MINGKEVFRGVLSASKLFTTGTHNRREDIRWAIGAKVRMLEDICQVVREYMQATLRFQTTKEAKIVGRMKLAYCERINKRRLVRERKQAKTLKPN